MYIVMLYIVILYIHVLHSILVKSDSGPSLYLLQISLSLMFVCKMR